MELSDAGSIFQTFGLPDFPTFGLFVSFFALNQLF